jgi:hypothetical protein
MVAVEVTAASARPVRSADWESKRTQMAELVEWRHVKRGDVVKMNHPDARWLMVHDVDQQWEPLFTHFDFVDVDGTCSHGSRPKGEVIRRKEGASVYDLHWEAMRRMPMEVDGADGYERGA